MQCKHSVNAESTLSGQPLSSSMPEGQPDKELTTIATYSVDEDQRLWQLHDRKKFNKFDYPVIAFLCQELVWW